MTCEIAIIYKREKRVLKYNNNSITVLCVSYIILIQWSIIRTLWVHHFEFHMKTAIL